jgi:hypothetical protein
MKLTLAVVLLAIAMIIPVAAVVSQEDASADYRTADARSIYASVGGADFPWADGDPIADLNRLDALEDIIGDLETRSNASKLSDYSWPSDINIEISELKSQYDAYLESVTDYIESAQAINYAKIAEDAVKGQFLTQFKNSINSIPTTKTYSVKAFGITISSHTYEPQKDSIKFLNALAKNSEKNGGPIDLGAIINLLEGDPVLDDDKGIWYAKAIEDSSFGTAVGLLKATWIIPTGPMTESDRNNYGNILTSTPLKTIAGDYSNAYDARIGAENDQAVAANARNIANGAVESKLSTVINLIEDAEISVGTAIVSASIEYDGKTIENGSTVNLYITGSNATFNLSLIKPIDLDAEYLTYNFTASSNSEGNAYVSVSGNVLTVTPVAKGIAEITISVDPTLSSGHDKYDTVKASDKTITINVWDNLTFTGPVTNLPDVYIGSDYVGKVAGTITANGGAAPITYSFVNPPSDSRITLDPEKGDVVISRDVNSGTYQFVLRATDKNGLAADATVNLTVENYYDERYQSMYNDLRAIQDELDIILALAEAFPDLIPPEILAFGDILSVYEEMWNNGYPQLTEDTVNELFEKMNAMGISTSSFNSFKPILTNISWNKKSMIDGYTVPIVNIKVPSIPELYHDSVLLAWEVLGSQITPLTKLLDSYNELQDFVVNTDYSEIRDLESVTAFTQELYEKYHAVNEALIGFNESNSLLVPIINGVLANSKDLLVLGIEELSDPIKDILTPLIGSTIENEDVREVVESLVDSGLEALTPALLDLINNLPDDITLDTIVGYSAVVDNILREVASKTTVISATVAYLNDIDLTKSLDVQLSELEAYAQELNDIGTKYNDDFALELSALITEKVNDIRSILEFIKKSIDLNRFIIGYDYADISDFQDVKALIVGLSEKYDAMQEALEALDNLSPGAEKIVTWILKKTDDALQTVVPALAPIAATLAVNFDINTGDSELDTEYELLLVRVVKIAADEINEALVSGDDDTLAGMTERSGRIADAIRKAATGLELRMIVFAGEKITVKGVYIAGQNVIFPADESEDGEENIAFNGWFSGTEKIGGAGKTIKLEKLIPLVSASDDGVTITLRAENVELYDIRFIGYDSSEVKVYQNKIAGDVIVAPKGPVREGYVFLNWTNNTTALSLVAGEDYTVDSNAVFFALYDQIYTVTFDGVPYTGTYGTTFIVPSAPESADKVFLYWDDNGTYYSAGAVYTIEEDATVISVYDEVFTVTFGNVVFTGVADDKITVPAGPVLPDKSFLYWDDGTDEVLPGDEYTIYATTDFDAIYEDVFTVTFGDLKFTGVENDKITAPAGPVLPDKSFLYWDDGTDEVLPGDEYTIYVTTDFDAIYENVFTVTFGNIVFSGVYGTTFYVPAAPVAPSADQVFVNWTDGTTTYAPGDLFTIGTDNESYNADFDTFFIVTVNYLGYQYFAVVISGQDFTFPVVATPAEYTFDGWSVNGADATGDLYFTPTGNAIVEWKGTPTAAPEYSITYSVISDGGGNIAQKTETIVAGQFGLLILTPDAGYGVSSVTAVGDFASLTKIAPNVYLVTATDNDAIEIAFAPIPTSSDLNVTIEYVNDTGSGQPGFNATVRSNDGGLIPGVDENGTLTICYTTSWTVNHNGVNEIWTDSYSVEQPITASVSSSTLTVSYGDNTTKDYYNGNLKVLVSGIAVFSYNDNLLGGISVNSQTVIAI